MSAEKWTVNSIKAACRARGSYWFDPDTMRFFGTKVLPTVYQGPGGVYFVTEDDKGPRPEDGKGYTVRQFVPEGPDIKTVGDVGGTANVSKARLKARNLARAAGELKDVEQTAEKFQEVTELQQFLDDLHRHGNPACGAGTARKLMKAAHRHKYYSEQACNTPEGAAFAERNTPKVEKEIMALAEAAGAIRVIFGGDPRGCTVKLVFKDGFTNDFAREGYCVPTESPK